MGVGRPSRLQPGPELRRNRAPHTQRQSRRAKRECRLDVAYQRVGTDLGNGSVWVHVITRDATLVHCHSIPSSGTEIGSGTSISSAVTARSATEIVRGSGILYFLASSRCLRRPVHGVLMIESKLVLVVQPMVAIGTPCGLD